MVIQNIFGSVVFGSLKERVWGVSLFPAIHFSPFTTFIVRLARFNMSLSFRPLLVLICLASTQVFPRVAGITGFPGPILPPKNGEIRCVNIDDIVDISYTDRNDKRYYARVKVGSNLGKHGGDHSCIGRCGPGCANDPNQPQGWTYDCLVHDVCVAHFHSHGMFMDADCGDEWDAGTEDWVMGSAKCPQTPTPVHSIPSILASIFHQIKVHIDSSAVPNFVHSDESKCETISVHVNPSTPN